MPAIGGYAAESGCSVIIVLNKWETWLRRRRTRIEQFTEAVRRRMKYLAYAPMLTVSALTGQRVSRLFEMIRKAYEGRRIRVPTGDLNKCSSRTWNKSDRRRITEPGARNPIHHPGTRSNPPTFIVFTRGRKPLHFSTERLSCQSIAGAIRVLRDADSDSSAPASSRAAEDAGLGIDSTGCSTLVLALLKHSSRTCHPRDSGAQSE